MAEDRVFPGAVECALVNSLRHFYTDEMLKSLLLPLIQQTGSVSLRMLDWLCVNYSKSRNIVSHGLDGSLHTIYDAYKRTLAVYKRRHFDPFRRKERVFVLIDGGKYETTLAQCNFIMWAYLTGVLDYASKHSADIEQDMNQFSARHRSYMRMVKSSGIPHKRSTLTHSGKSDCRIYSHSTHVSFDVVGQ